MLGCVGFGGNVGAWGQCTLCSLNPILVDLVELHYIVPIPPGPLSDLLAGQHIVGGGKTKNSRVEAAGGERKDTV